jgi:hypothetical protein
MLQRPELKTEGATSKPLPLVGWSRESGDRKGGGRLRVQDADGTSQSAISHIDETLALIGYVDGTPVFGRTRRFANGELIALIGEAAPQGGGDPAR